MGCQEGSRTLTLKESQRDTSPKETLKENRKENDLMLSISKLLRQDRQVSSTKKGTPKQDFHQETTTVKANRDFLCVRKKMMSNIDSQIPNILLNSSRKIREMLLAQDTFRGGLQMDMEEKWFNNDKGLNSSEYGVNEPKSLTNLENKLLAENNSCDEHENLFISLESVLENADMDIQINVQNIDQSQRVSELPFFKQKSKQNSNSGKEYHFLDLDIIDGDEVKKEDEEVVQESLQTDIDMKKNTAILIESQDQVSHPELLENDTQPQENHEESQIEERSPDEEAFGFKIVINISQFFESGDEDNVKQPTQVEPKDTNLEDQLVLEIEDEVPTTSNIAKDYVVQGTNRFQAKSWPPNTLEIEPQELQVENKPLINASQEDTQPEKVNENEESKIADLQGQGNNLAQENVSNLLNQVSLVKGKGYTVYEDWRIIQSLETYNQNNNSEEGLKVKNLWAKLTDPLTGEKVLGDSRSRDSIRTRNRTCVSLLKQEDKEYIHKFIREHSEEEARCHYVKFKTDKITNEKKFFDIVKRGESKDGKAKAKKEGSAAKVKANKKRKAPLQGNVVKEPQNLLKRVKHEDSCLEKFPQVQISLPKKPAKSVSDKVFICVDLENDCRHFVRDEEVKNSKENESLGDIWQDLSALSAKYKISINKLNVLLGQVSCSFEDLERYLKMQEARILWNAQEDQDLLEGSEIALRYLKMLKGEQSVDRRKKYLMDF